jgi:two-component system chemotaxis sensor kinase CheA
MPETIDRAATGAELQAQLDEVATTLVLGGVKSGVAAQLSRLSARASAEGWNETSRAAAQLAAKISASPESSPEIESAIAADLSSLRQALERETTQRPTSSNTSSNSIAQDPELIGDFIVEAREHLDSIEGRMLILEQNPAEMETIHAVFRSFHTIKGLAGFLELAEIRGVAHEVETLLDLARDCKLPITPSVVDVVLESADYLKHAIEVVESTLSGRESQPFGDNRSLLLRLQRITGETPEADAFEPVQIDLGPDDPVQIDLGPSGPSSAADSIVVVAGRPAASRASDTASVRVETAKLDYLMDMVGEMVIAQSLIRNNPGLTTVRDARLLADLTQLARITGEVQRTTMDMRMIPIGQLFQRTGRMVRDLARKAGKRVDLETVGEDTELDKTIAEELTDPLLHMVRNSIDHGIENPAERALTGKNPVARVRLAAYHNGGQIIIEISDDGRGLDREKIIAKALRNGLIENGAHLSDLEAYNLIFEPGFSTAEQVTDISGRGVGMDVVRKHVQKLRGRIDIQSRPGQGTTFLLKLPLTLAIIEGLVVNVGSEQYIVPIFAVKELFRPTSESIFTVQGQDEMALVRGSLLPVVRLYQYFGVKPKSENPCDGLLLVAECQEKLFCLLVDGLVGKQEVVIKSLGEMLKNIPGIAGGSILGNGRVGLILDMDGVYRRRSQ